MAQIKIKCPHCQSEMEGEEEWLGQEAVCPFCQKTFAVERAPARPKLVHPAVPSGTGKGSVSLSSVPPERGKKIVLLLAGGTVILLLAAGGAWLAFSKSSSAIEMKPVEAPAEKTEAENPFKVPPLSAEMQKENCDEIDFSLIASELEKDPTTELKPQISDLLLKCRNHFIRNGDWQRYVRMVTAMSKVMPQETQRFSSEIDVETRNLTERFHRSLSPGSPEILREAIIEQLEQIDPQHPLAAKYRADRQQGITPGLTSGPASGSPSGRSYGNPQRRPMPPEFQLRMAVMNGYVLLTKKLLESGVDPNSPRLSNQPQNRRLMTAALSKCKGISPDSPMRQKMIGCILLLRKHGVNFLPEEQSVAQSIPELTGE